MTRLVTAVALAAAVAGCGGPPSGLSPDDAFGAAMVAVDSGDAVRALALLDEAADAGHLQALAVRAEAYGRGYLRTDYGRGYQRGVLPANVRFVVWPGQAARTARAYHDALRAGVDRGDADATLQLAHELAEPKYIDGRWVKPPADRDSARALYRRLRAAGADPYRLAMLAYALDDTAERDRQLAAAADAGNGEACWLRLWWTGGPRDLATAAGFSAFVDDAEAGPPEMRGEDPVARDLRALTDQARSGNAAAVALLDSLDAGGLFERHPRLAAVVAARQAAGAGRG